ncbi:sugar kinase [Streptomyces sp. Tu 2975]|uniref:PfkB family carbohydrate kinase n=1 Tax=Streptomyces sp. Tu 2975 TaxID=2676871 RepID=UPI0013587507|nr:PfkB family carbohydrate kinase [Streptomyces sp. Tu 2975]QIP83363.1 sugar kinase [Streptomyces sp. Tu 2975]
MSRDGVLVLGEALIDLVPEPGDPGLLRAQPGGAPANVAVGLARLGTPASFAGTLGGDVFARSIEHRLTHAGVDLSLCGRSPLPTTLAVADPGPEGTAYHFHTDRTATFQLPDRTADVPRYGAVYVGGLAAVVEPAASTVAATAGTAARAGLLAVDPNVREDRTLGNGPGPDPLRELCAAAHVVKASDEDLARLWPGREPDASCRELAHGGKLVVMTRGARGSTAYTAGGAVVSVPAVPVHVVNTIGAGDAFMAGMLAWLAAGAWRLDLPADRVEAMLGHASEVAASVCAQAGTEPEPAMPVTLPR